MLASSVSFQFTFSNLERYFQVGIDQGYKIIPCREYPQHKQASAQNKILVNRVDIDFSVKKAGRIATIFNNLGIKGTFFVRLHANEYNPFSFENYKILKFIRDSGHEIGYHSEIVDQAVIWNEAAADCLHRDIDVIERMFETKIVGVASHGGMTGINNLDFWQDKKPSDFGLLYEAYDKQPEFNLFNESLYVSDSSWTYWKCYLNGKSDEGNRKSLGEHLADGHPLVYSLIHPETFYDSHFYE